MKHLTISTQDYLKNIYDLTENGKNASTNALAAKLNISAPSVTGMIKKLSSTEPPLVEYQKHPGVTLTKDGARRRAVGSGGGDRRDGVGSGGSVVFSGLHWGVTGG
jgi:Mn-dependent DtxR family transcriptional regulator